MMTICKLKSILSIFDHKLKKKRLKIMINRSHQIGHFSQVVRDASHAIGCAASRYTMEYEGKPWNATLLTCNYSRNNPLVGEQVYEPGPTASKCQTGTNPDYAGLCSEHEQYNEDPYDGWIIDAE